MTLPKEREEDGLLFNKNDTIIEAIVRAARECAIGVASDTCGVCGLHFHECEEEKSSHDDPPFNADNQFFSCAGARVRQALARHDETVENWGEHAYYMINRPPNWSKV
jgi:hypothetical protein